MGKKFNQQKRSSIVGRVWRLPPIYPIAIVSLLGLAMVLAAFFGARTWQQADERKAFDTAIEKHVQAFRDELEEVFLLGEVTASLLGRFGSIDQGDFTTIVGPQVSERPNVLALAVAKRTDAQSRPLVESRLDKRGIWEFAEDGSVIDVGLRPQYYPLHLIEPLAGNELALGFDVMSSPELERLLRASSKSGQPKMSGVLPLLRSDQLQGLYLVHTVTALREKQVSPGYVIIETTADHVMRSAIGHLADLGVDAHLFDMTAIEGQQFLAYQQALDGSVAGERQQADSEAVDAEYFHAESFSQGRRRWLLLLTGHAQHGVVALIPWAILAVGLSMLSLLLAYLYFLIERARKIRELVKIRTAELGESETRFRQIAENVREVFWVRDLKQRKLIYLNPAFESIWGVPMNAAIDDINTWKQSIHHDDTERVMQSGRETVKQGRLQQEYRIVRPDGTERWIRDRSFSVLNKAGEPYRLVGIAEDITDSRNTLNQLERELERIEVTLKSIADGVITTDSHGNVDYMNPAAELITGWRGAESQRLAASQVFQIKNGETGELLPDPVVECLQGESVLSLVEERPVLLRLDGAEVAVDYTTAPILDRSGGAIGAVLVFHDVSAQRSLTDDLSHRASHDSLTGLVNREGFENALQRHMESSRAQDRTHVLGYLDLDRFKQVNDTCGHAAGDQLLRDLSQRMNELLRTSDTLGRLGGDEFGVLLENCSIQQAEKIAEKLRQSVYEYRFLWQGETFRVGVSIGLVQVAGSDLSVSEMLKAADKACYVAKNEGRNTVHIGGV